MDRADWLILGIGGLCLASTFVYFMFFGL